MNLSGAGHSTTLFGSVPSEAINKASGTSIKIADDLVRNRHGETFFEARFARLPTGGDLRTVHIHGPKVEIINLFHFPAPDRALPVYAIEFVVFGRRPVVGVIDVKPLSSDPWTRSLWRETMESAHASFPELGRADDPPDWYEECRSGLDFFTRPQHLDGVDQLLSCHDYVWTRLAAAEVSAPFLRGSETACHDQAIAHYKNHHRCNSPGLPFLNRSFGPEWTDRFLRTALFA